MFISRKFTAIYILSSLHLSTATVTLSMRPRISIASLTFTEPRTDIVPLPWNIAVNSLQRQSAVVKLGMEYLRDRFGETFIFNHRFLYNESRPGLVLLADDAEYFVGQFYFTENPVSDGLALISGCARDQFYSSRLTKEMRMINLCSVGNGLTLQEHPERISISLYPGSAMLRFLTLMLDENNWTSIAGVVETSSIAREAFSSGISDILSAGFAARTLANPIFRYNVFRFDVRTGSEEVRNTLTKIGQVSRIVIIFGSGVAAKAVMETAEKLNMTNGEYVFIMFALQTHGGIPMNDGIPNDTDWIISPANAHLDIRYQVYPSKSVLLLSFEAVYTEQSVQHLRNRILEITRSEFNLTYYQNQVPTMLYSTYEEFLIYGIVLNDTYTRTGKILDGPNLVKHCLNRTFQLPTGELYINQEGERIMDILGDVLEDSGKFQTMVRYDHKTDRLTSQDSIQAHWPSNSWPPPNEPQCGFTGSTCIEHAIREQQIKTGATAGTLIVILVTTAVVATWLLHQYIMLNSTWWRVSQANTRCLSRRLSGFHANVDNISRNTKKKEGRAVQLDNGDLAWKTALCAAEDDIKLNVSPDLLRFLLSVNQLHHANVNRFMGIITDSIPLYIVEKYCKRGSLDDFLDDSKVDMDMAFSFMLDLVEGMSYIHHSFLKFHGNLRSSKCLLDAQFGLQISDIANERLAHILVPIQLHNKPSLKADVQSRCDLLFWTAPEILRGKGPSSRGDIFSFAIIAYQILSGRSIPYAEISLTNQEIIENVQSALKIPFRPIVDFQVTATSCTIPGVNELIAQCWADDRSQRPLWSEIKDRLHTAMREAGLDETRSLFDRVMVRLTSYSATLEELVAQRTEQLQHEREKCDVILGEMLPRPVIHLLRSGKAVAPENFECATVMFTDISGFVQFVDRTVPLVVMEFLHLVYSRFDEVLSQYQVYKVETIADSYMVASGLPERNEKNHIRQICRLALALNKLFPRLSVTRGLQDTDKSMYLRVGIHSGPVVAGVVGHKTPRYCLFGDTINMASRMQSYSLPSKIHLSEPAALLAEETGFLITSRGETEIKGKGLVRTFWLENESTALEIAQKYVSSIEGL